MRLLQTTTLKLEEFNKPNRPPYAILSHTWGDEEVTYQEMSGSHSQPTWKSGYQKIAWTCQQARKDGIQYAWVDTCCIDKTSSAELSEAINSMFMWYENAQVCYAYLGDVPSSAPKAECLWTCKWVTRGWTLQELLAPCEVIFFASHWTSFGSRFELAASIAVATGIDRFYLEGGSTNGQRIRQASIAQRMAWAARRETSRQEDLAYCLLGIFSINMPLLYGEGRRSFVRLQEEIVRRTDDLSIFAWTLHLVSFPDGKEDFPDSELLQSQLEGNHQLSLQDISLMSCIFAPSPAAFAGSRYIRCIDIGEDTMPFSLTNRGIRFDLRLLKRHGKIFQLLPCQNHKDQTTILGIRLIPLIGNRYARLANEPLAWIDYHDWPRITTVPGYLITEFSRGKQRPPSNCLALRAVPAGFTVKQVSPGYTWDPQENLVRKTNFWPAEYGASESLTIYLAPPRWASYSQVSITLSFRQFKGKPTWYEYDVSSRPAATLWASQDVTYDDRESKSKSGSDSSSRSRSKGRSVPQQEAVFAEISYQQVFGKLVVVDIRSTSNPDLIRELRRRDAFHHLVSTVCFTPIDFTGSWAVLKHLLGFVEMATQSTHGLALVALIGLTLDLVVVQAVNGALQRLHLTAYISPLENSAVDRLLPTLLPIMVISDIIVVAFARRLMLAHLKTRLFLDALALLLFGAVMLDPKRGYITHLANMVIVCALSAWMGRGKGSR